MYCYASLENDTYHMIITYYWNKTIKVKLFTEIKLLNEIKKYRVTCGKVPIIRDYNLLKLNYL